MGVAEPVAVASGLWFGTKPVILCFAEASKAVLVPLRHGCGLTGIFPEAYSAGSFRTHLFRGTEPVRNAFLVTQGSFTMQAQNINPQEASVSRSESAAPTLFTAATGFGGGKAENSTLAAAGAGVWPKLAHHLPLYQCIGL